MISPSSTAPFISPSSRSSTTVRVNFMGVAVCEETTSKKTFLPSTLPLRIDSSSPPPVRPILPDTKAAFWMNSALTGVVVPESSISMVPDHLPVRSAPLRVNNKQGKLHKTVFIAQPYLKQAACTSHQLLTQLDH